MASTLSPIPMTAEEKEWLMSVFKLRKANIFPAAFFGCLLQYLVAMGALIFFYAFLHDAFLWDGVSRFKWAWLFEWLPIDLGLVLLAGVITCVLAYYYWALPFRQDAVAGVKNRVGFKVLDKNYYPLTDQYFVKPDNRMDKYYEVSATIYNSCEVNGVLYMEQAPRSGYIFNLGDRVVVKLFAFIARGDRGYDGFFGSGW